MLSPIEPAASSVSRPIKLMLFPAPSAVSPVMPAPVERVRFWLPKLIPPAFSAPAARLPTVTVPGRIEPVTLRSPSSVFETLKLNRPVTLPTPTVAKLKEGFKTISPATFTIGPIFTSAPPTPVPVKTIWVGIVDRVCPASYPTP